MLSRDEHLSLAVLGCGHWGPNHVRVFSSLPGVTVTRAIDPADDRRAHVGALHRGVVVTERWEDALEDDRVEAIVIATPAATHHHLALAALGAGKHVLCEKPLALSSAECAELVAAAAAAGVVLMVGHVFLFNPGILKLKELVDRAELGRIYYASAVRTNLGPIRRDVNVSYDLAAHEISIFNFLFGCPPRSASACGRAYLRRGVEDVVFISLTYPGEVIAGITVSWLSPKKVREIALVGEARMATWNDLATGPVAIHEKKVVQEPYYDSFGEFQLLTRDGDVTIPKVEPQEPLRLQARFFIDAVRRGSATICNGERGYEVVRTLEAIGESMRSGGMPVEVQLPQALAERAVK